MRNLLPTDKIAYSNRLLRWPECLYHFQTLVVPHFAGASTGNDTIIVNLLHHGHLCDRGKLETGDWEGKKNHVFCEFFKLRA